MGGDDVKGRLTAIGLSALVVAGLGLTAKADPVEDTLEIDGKPMITVAPAPEGHPFDVVYSGWLFREPETRAVEADSFQNPGMLSVELGQTLWDTVECAAGKSCASCHEDAAQSMAGVGARYPKWDADSGKPINVELMINKCRTENMGAEPYKFDQEEQKAMTAFIKHQSLGEPVKLDLAEGDMQSWWDRGKEVYYTRTGQLNLACASCHEAIMGKNIRADHLSQGQVNGFPTYRFNTAGMVSLHNRFRGCIRDTRAESFAEGSDEFRALELYVASRGMGLSIEGVSVRP